MLQMLHGTIRPSFLNKTTQRTFANYLYSSPLNGCNEKTMRSARVASWEDCSRLHDSIFIRKLSKILLGAPLATSFTFPLCILIESQWNMLLELLGLSLHVSWSVLYWNYIEPAPGAPWRNSFTFLHRILPLKTMEMFLQLPVAIPGKTASSLWGQFLYAGS